MSSKKKKSKVTREQLLAHCGQLQDDDCVDPKEFFKPDRKTDKANKKARQLCRQAAHTLDMVLADCDDEWMQSLLIANVQPAPDSTRLHVTVCADVAPERFDRNTILAHLQEQVPRLRAELARSISRKRVPNLTFSIIYKDSLDADRKRKEESDE